MDRIQKSSVCIERKEDKLTKILPKSMKSFQGELKKIRLEMESAKEVESRAESRFSHGECEHAAALHDAQHIQVPRDILRWMGGGRMAKRMNLKLKGLEIILISRSFERSRWRRESSRCYTKNCHLDILLTI